MGCLPFMSPCPGVAVSWPPPPCCGCGVVSLPVAWPPCPWRGLCARAMVSVSVAWSLCPWHGLRVHGVVSVPVARSPCPWHGLRASGMVSVSMARSPCPWRGLRASGMVSVSMVWSPCPWRGLRVRGAGLRGRGVVSVAVAWSPWPCLASAASPLVFSPPTCRWVFSLLKICLQSESSCMAPATDIDCTDLTPCTKFPESPLRGDSRLIHTHKLPSRGHTLSSFPLSVYQGRVPTGFLSG